MRRSRVQAALYDRVVILEDIPADFSDELVPTGTEGVVVEVFRTPQEGYAIDLQLPADDLVGGPRFENVIVRPGQFKVLEDEEAV